MIFALVAASALAVSMAACPNACSGNGVCGQYDRCSCHRDWTSADCSQRVCPSAFAFITTPQGDLNMDGDRYDNSGKLIVGSNEKGQNNAAQTGSMAINSNKFTFSNTGKAIANGEIVAGDAVKIEGEQYVVIEVVGRDEILLDHRALSAVSAKPVYRFLETQANPAGDWESWPGDYSNNADEGHYYMECSNRGLCDRKTGQCECFEGYEGRACARTACPNNCNGHGTCESVTELAAMSPHKKSWHAMATAAELNQVATDIDSSAVIGDRLVFGDSSTVYTVTAKTSTRVTVTPALKSAIVDWTSVAQVSNYKLWDAEKNQACKCDSLYTGYDCSARKCPRGDDPLTTQSENNVDNTASSGGWGTFVQANEQQTIVITPSLDTSELAGTFSLTFQDMYGKDWTTADIPIVKKVSTTATWGTNLLTFSGEGAPKSEIQEGGSVRVGGNLLTVGDCTEKTESAFHYTTCAVNGTQDAIGSGRVEVFTIANNASVRSALEGLPNGVVEHVRVEKRDAQVSNGIRFLATFGSNSGDLPAMKCDSSGLAQASYAGSAGSVTAANPGKISFTTWLDPSVAATAPSWVAGDKVRIGDELRVVAFNDTNDIYVSAPFENTYAGQPVQKVETSHTTGSSASKYVSCSVTDTARIVSASAYATAEVGGTDYKEVTLDAAASVAADIVLGTRIRVQKSAGVYETRVVDSVSGTAITVSSGFSGAIVAGAQIWVVGTGTTEDNTCSGRGLCSSESGVCECFAGYTLDDCSAQNALAA
jgi:hypothetical protein